MIFSVRRRLLAALYLFTFLPPVAVAGPAVLRVVGDDYPPFLIKSADGLSGPYADAFKLLMRKAGIEVVFQSMPLKRAFLSLSTQGNLCALAVNFDQGESERVNFVRPIAPITLTAYKRADLRDRLGSLQDLKRHTLGAVDIAEVRDALGSAGLPYTPVKNASVGFLMLNAGRFQALVSDLPPSAEQGKTRPVRLFILAQAERWLACGPSVPPALLVRMRGALKQGVFALATWPVWQRYGMQNYYQETRASWLKAS